MTKRILATLTALVLVLGMVGGAQAAEGVTIKVKFLDRLTIFDTAGSAIDSENRHNAAASMYLEYLLWQLDNDQELLAGPLYEDCVIGRSGASIGVIYGDDECMLILTYNTATEEMQGGVVEMPCTEIVAKSALEGAGCTDVCVVDGDEWTDVLQQMIQVLTGDN